MERINTQTTFTDVVTQELGGPRTTALLMKLEQAVPWEALAQPIRKLYTNGVQGGRRPWPAVMMLKCLMLAKWFGLSDPQLEEALQDRLSFRRFVGLSVDDETPDETTFVRFRTRLREAGMHERLFDQAVRHLERQGLVVKQGTLVDATIIKAPIGRKRPDGSNTRDPEASYTKNHGHPAHGFKGHIAADRSGIVTAYRFATAKVHDSKFIDELTSREGVAVYADSAYMDGEREARLKRRGVRYRIAYRRVRGQQELTPKQQRHNRLVASVRAKVEHVFAWLWRMGGSRARYRGLARNEFDFALTLVAYNFKRSLHLHAAVG